MSRVLSLRVAAAAPWEPAVTTPVRVTFTTDQPRRDASGPGGSPARWHQRQSACEHKTTNDLLNVWQRARVDAVPLIEYVRCQDLWLWQFAPSYLWPAVFRAVELIDVLWSLADEIHPDCLQVLEEGAGLDPVSRHVLIAFGRAAGLDVRFVAPPVRDRIGHVATAVRRRLRRFGVGRMLYRMEQAWWKAMMTAMSRRAPKASATGRTVLWVTRARDWVADPQRPGRSYDDQYFPLLAAFRQRGWTRVVAVDAPYGNLRFVA